MIVRDPKYLKALRSAPCLVTGRRAFDGEDVVPAHIGRRPGVGMKASDDTCIPLLARVHREGHQTGEMRYYFLSMRDEAHRVVFDGISGGDRRLIQGRLSEYAQKQYRIWKDGGEPFEDV